MQSCTQGWQSAGTNTLFIFFFCVIDLSVSSHFVSVPSRFPLSPFYPPICSMYCGTFVSTHLKCSDEPIKCLLLNTLTWHDFMNYLLSVFFVCLPVPRDTMCVEAKCPIRITAKSSEKLSSRWDIHSLTHWVAFTVLWSSVESLKRTLYGWLTVIHVKY